MIRLTVKDIANAVNGSLMSGNENVWINGVSTDSRTIRKGELFFALKGPNFDGHRFIEDVLNKGAAGAVINAECGMRNAEFPVIQVEDTLAALGDLARYWRELHPVPLIAVSGSCGKTTTKEMIASILNVSRTIIKTEGNLNNLIGLPLTLFGLNNIHKAAVVELGISEKGEMRKLVQICKPDVAVLTNIGEAHTAKLGSIEGVASAKGELFQEMDTGGTAIINMDDPRLASMAENIRAKKITFSLKSKADVMLKGERQETTFIVMGEEIPVKLQYAGAHNLSNAAAAIAAAIQLGATKEEIIEGLSSVKPLCGRMEIISLANGITIIDDTYNANPLSMEASLKSLAAMNPVRSAHVEGNKEATGTGVVCRVTSNGVKGRKIAVLADMLELGDIAQAAHKNIGRLAKEFGIDILFATGNFRKDVAKGALDAGMPADKIFEATDKTGLVEALHNIIRDGDSILVKGSRGMKMEEVVKQLSVNCKLITDN